MTRWAAAKNQHTTGRLSLGPAHSPPSTKPWARGRLLCPLPPSASARPPMEGRPTAGRSTPTAWPLRHVPSQPCAGLCYGILFPGNWRKPRSGKTIHQPNPGFARARCWSKPRTRTEAAMPATWRMLDRPGKNITAQHKPLHKGAQSNGLRATFGRIRHILDQNRARFGRFQIWSIQGQMQPISAAVAPTLDICRAKLVNICFKLADNIDPCLVKFG